MSHNYFIADPHFGHKNIIKYTRCQFDTVDEHDAWLVDQINSTVQENDHLWILGDVAFGNKAFHHNMSQIKCKNLKLVGGNHDTLSLKHYTEYFSRIVGQLDYKKSTLLSHIPVHPSQKVRYKLNIHGHYHEKIVTIENEKAKARQWMSSTAECAEAYEKEYWDVNDYIREGYMWNKYKWDPKYEEYGMTYEEWENSEVGDWDFGEWELDTSPRPDQFYFNVSVEQNNGIPVKWEDIVERYEL